MNNINIHAVIKMSSFWNFAFGFILVLVWIVSGGYITQANVYLDSYKNRDADFNRAYTFTFWAAFVTWFLVGLFILLVILSVVGVVALFGSGVGEAGAAAEGAEATEGMELSRSGRAREYLKSPEGQNTISGGVSWFTIGFLIFALILVGTTGILAALAASSMIKSPHYNPSVKKLKTAYTDCVIAASLCLGAGGLLIIGIIVYFIVGFQREKKVEVEDKFIEQKKQVELAEIKEAREKAIREKVEQREQFKEELQQAEEQKILNRVLKE